MFTRTITLMLKARRSKSLHDKAITISRYLFIKTLKYLNITATLSIRDVCDIRYIARPNCSISEKLFVVGLYDYDGMSFLLEQIRCSDIFYDIGANIGPFSLLASKATPNIYAYEGHPETTQRLKDNFKLNGMAEDKAINIAITEESGYIKFRDEAGSATNKIKDSDDEGLLVKCSSVDELSKTFGIPRLIKIDTEGHEASVFRGMREVLSSGEVDYISFEANGISSKKDLAEIFKYLKENNYSIGNIDYEKKKFHIVNSLGKKSDTGDYQALSKNLQYQILSKGYEITH